MTSRKDGELIRLHHSVQRMRAHLDAVEVAIARCGPIGTEVAQGVAQTAVEVAMQIAKHDAYDMAERDAAPPMIPAGLTKGSAR